MPVLCQATSRWGFRQEGSEQAVEAGLQGGGGRDGRSEEGAGEDRPQGPAAGHHPPPRAVPNPTGRSNIRRTKRLRAGKSYWPKKGTVGYPEVALGAQAHPRASTHPSPPLPHPQHTDTHARTLTHPRALSGTHMKRHKKLRMETQQNSTLKIINPFKNPSTINPRWRFENWRPIYIYISIYL